MTGDQWLLQKTLTSLFRLVILNREIHLLNLAIFHSVIDPFVKFLDIEFENGAEPFTISLLDLLSSAKALKLSINLDGHLGAQCFRFFHGMRRHNQCRISTLISDSLPEPSPGVRINSCRGFIKHDNLRFIIHCNRSDELPLVSTTEFVRVSIEKLIHLKFLSNQFSIVCRCLLIEAFQLAEKY